MKFATSLLLLVIASRLAGQVTETPDTIAPGKFFVRMDAVSFGINHADTGPEKFTALGVANTVVSTGVTSDFDVQLGMQAFVRESYQFRGVRTTHSGLGDLSLRAKWTYLRNDKIGAAAVIPYVKVPTNSGGVGNDHVEGGLIFPWAMSLATGTVAGAMAEWDYRRNAANDGYDSRWYTSAFLRQHIVGRWGVYGEATLEASSATASSFTGSLGGGVTWDFLKTLQFDYGLSRGLGYRATDWLHALRIRLEF